MRKLSDEDLYQINWQTKLPGVLMSAPSLNSLSSSTSSIPYQPFSAKA